MKTSAASITRLLGFPIQITQSVLSQISHAAIDDVAAGAVDPEPLLCEFCSGTGRCTQCDGAGWRHVGKGWMGMKRSVICIVCYRSGKCQLCYGNGAYRADH